MSTVTGPYPFSALLWTPAPLPGVIERGEIHVWSWSFAGEDGIADKDLAVLNELERHRTRRFRFPLDQVRYSSCHARMRRILGSYLQQPPSSLDIRDGVEGKPEVFTGGFRNTLRFNLSHSKSIGVLAVARDAEVGVDVEDVRPIQPGVAQSHFSPAELSSLADLHGDAWLEAFYRCWTRKEAVLKAEGVGLRIPLDSFDVSVRAEEPAALLAARPQARMTTAWRLHHLHPASGTIGALAAEGVSERLVCRALVD